MFIKLLFLTTLEHDDGLYKIRNGDAIIMDNCGFRHGRNTEPQLRAITANSALYSYKRTGVVLCEALIQVRRFVANYVVDFLSHQSTWGMIS